MNQQRFVIQRARKRAVKVRIGLVGVAGSGKTFTALAIATGLVERPTDDGPRILLIDTEAESSVKYACRFDFDHLVLPDHSPSTYADALEHAAGLDRYDVVIVDSLSHAWIGKEGALEQVDKIAKRSRSGNTFTAWGDVTPQHRRMIDTILESPFHVIGTMRAKTEYVLEDNGKGKQVPRKVGMAPVQRDGMEYEFDLVGDLTDAHELLISKTRLLGLVYRKRDVDLGVVERPGTDFGEVIRAWCNDGESAGEHEARKAEAERRARMEAEERRAAEALDRLAKVRAGAVPKAYEASPHLGALLEAIVDVVESDPSTESTRFLSAYKHVDSTSPYGETTADVLDSDDMVRLLTTSAAPAYARMLLACLAHRYGGAPIGVLVSHIDRASAEAVVSAARRITASAPWDRQAAYRAVIAELVGPPDGPDDGGDGGDDEPEEGDDTDEGAELDDGFRRAVRNDSPSAESPTNTTAGLDEGLSSSAEGATDDGDDEPDPSAREGAATAVWCQEESRTIVVPFRYTFEVQKGGQPMLPSHQPLAIWCDRMRWDKADSELPLAFTPAIGHCLEKHNVRDHNAECRAFLALLKQQHSLKAFDLAELYAVTPELSVRYADDWPTAERVAEQSEDRDVAPEPGPRARILEHDDWRRRQEGFPEWLVPYWERVLSEVASTHPDAAERCLRAWRMDYANWRPWRLLRAPDVKRVGEVIGWETPDERTWLGLMLDGFEQTEGMAVEHRTSMLRDWFEVLPDLDLRDLVAVADGYRMDDALRKLCELCEGDPQLEEFHARAQAAKAQREHAKYDSAPGTQR